MSRPCSGLQPGPVPSSAGGELVAERAPSLTTAGYASVDLEVNDSKGQDRGTGQREWRKHQGDYKKDAELY